MPNLINVVAGLIYRQDRYLITKRPEGKHLEGHWEFPGGKKEHGESNRDALKRELREELGIRVHVGSKVFRTKHKYPDRTVDIQFYFCRMKPDQSPSPEECASLSWVPPEDLCTYSFPPADRPLVQKLMEREIRPDSMNTQDR